jgi:arylsulfatase A-like enzyme
MRKAIFFTLHVLLLSALSCEVVRGADTAGSRPNIVFILADDLGYGELGSYGQKKIQTPNLDKMAAEGLRFTQFYAGAPVCAPSRCVLMTGRHQGRARVRGNGGGAAQRLTQSDPTVAKVLSAAGYRTGLIGKWGLGEEGDEGDPQRQGFGFFYGFLNQVHAHNHFPSFLWRNGVRESLPNVVKLVGDHGGGYATEARVYADDVFTEEALKFIGEEAEQPFFLYLSYVLPHANNERTRELGNGAEVPDYGPYSDQSWELPNRGQAAMISRLDGYVGRILAELNRLGKDRQTLVIFSSDNGPHQEAGNDPAFFEASGPLQGLKRSLTEGGIRVPFIARWPGRIVPGVTGHVGYFGDFMATAAELAGAGLPSEHESVSLVPLLSGRPEVQSSHRFLYWEFQERGFLQAALMDGRWKAIGTGPEDPNLRLYDLMQDVGEVRDLAVEKPEVVSQLRAYLRTARTESPFWQGPRVVAPNSGNGRK